MPEITHVRISNEGNSIYCELDNGYHYLYYQESGEVVRLHQCVIPNNKQKLMLVTVERVFMRNSWAELIAKYQAHPMNWQNKLNARMLQFYKERREHDAQMKLTGEAQ